MITHFSNDLKCEVCNAAISFPESIQLKDLGYLVCKSFDCRKIMSQKSTMTSSLFQSHLNFQRNQYNVRLAEEAAKKKYVEETKEREEKENQRILQFILDNDEGITCSHNLSKNNIHVVEIPSGLSRPIPLSEDRIGIYKTHLNQIISQAFEKIESLEDEAVKHQKVIKKFIKTEKRFTEYPLLRTLSDKLCTMCKGGCCTSGADHAYLSSVTIQRLLNSDPGLSDTDISNLYLPTIASETMAGACINQTGTGCALPKELRSDICNSFYCESLKSFQFGPAVEESTVFVAAIQRSGTCWNSCGFEVCNDVVNVVLFDENGVDAIHIPRLSVDELVAQEFDEQ